MPDNYINTYYGVSDLETMYALSPLVGIAEQISDYDNLKYRLANAEYIGAVPVLSRSSYIKGDFAAYMATRLRAIITVAIAYYGQNPTFTQLVTAFQALDLDYTSSYYLAYFVLYLYCVIPGDLGSQLLTNPQTFAGWTVANGFSISSERLRYQHNALGGTAARVSFITAPVLDVWHKLDLTLSGVTGACGTLNITTAFASAATYITIANGKQTIPMKSNAGGVTNFIFSAAGSSAAAEYFIDNVELNEIQANMGTLDANGIRTYTIEQTIADFAIRTVREIRQAEARFYDGNPVV